MSKVTMDASQKSQGLEWSNQSHTTMRKKTEPSIPCVWTHNQSQANPAAGATVASLLSGTQTA